MQSACDVTRSPRSILIHPHFEQCPPLLVPALNQILVERRCPMRFYAVGLNHECALLEQTGAFALGAEDPHYSDSRRTPSMEARKRAVACSGSFAVATAESTATP